MRNLLVGLFLFGLCFSSSAKPGLFVDKQLKLSDSVIEILRDISKHNVYEYKTVGIAGTLSKQYLRYEQLARVATIDELLQISKDYKNAVARLYAFQALKLKGFVIPKDLQEQFDNDKTEIQTLNGCLGNISKIAELSKENFISQGSTIQIQNKDQK
jgi:hypothetical protein